MITLIHLAAEADPAAIAAPSGRIDGWVLAAEVLDSRVVPPRGAPVIVALVDPRPPRLRAALAGAPDAVLLSLADGADLQQIDARLAVAEAELGLADRSTGIWAGVGGSAGAVFKLGTLAGATTRLRGLVWDDGPLAGAIGAVPQAGPVQVARALAVLAAHAAGVPILLAVQGGAMPDGEAVRQEGFAGVLLGWTG